MQSSDKAEMPKKYDHKECEARIYKMWEDGGYFKAEIDPAKKPYTILLPPPNASGKMHTGNVLMIAIEDLLIRWKRMQGYSALWIPGTDHAGFETQVKFERKLNKEGKSRLDYDSKTLYKMIWDFVYENKDLIENQIRGMGASIDWSRYKFTLDQDVLDLVLATFKKMHAEGLIYRDDYMVNYCPQCGTTFADLEVKHIERTSPLYYMKYGPFTLATTRPETKFGDTAIAVHPDDVRYQKYIGKEIETEGLNGTFNLKVIADKYVDPKFGTGVVKITPAHDKNDYEIGKRHNLEVKSVIGLDGKLNAHCGKYAGLAVDEAREAVVKDLEKAGLMEKIDYKYRHLVSVCYKQDHIIEPTVLPNWFVRVDSLKKPAHDVVKNGKVKIFPKWQEIKYHRWMEEMHNWPISRQVVWGIRIPAWYSVEENPNLQVTFTRNSVSEASDDKVVSGKVGELLKEYSFEQIEAGLQSLIAPKDAKFVISVEKPTQEVGVNDSESTPDNISDKHYLQETDTFDTWFSSGQWPLACTGYPDSEDFKYFYPTSVLETGWEILRLWVSRMIMFGIYLTGKPPFKDVYLHGMVRALDGKKMSKSLGNEIIPDDYQDEYGTDALRMGLISGTANGKDFAFPADKVIAYRNFANKIWNMARFMNMMMEREGYSKADGPPFYNEDMRGDLSEVDIKMVENLKKLIKNVNKNLEKYRFADAADAIYHFMWDDLAAEYIEHVKNLEDKNAKKIGLSVLRHIFIKCLILLHPFMPFVTEEVWSHIPRKYNDPLIVSKWPEEK